MFIPGSPFCEISVTYDLPCSKLNFKKIQKSPGVAVHVFSPSTGRQRYVDLREFEAQPCL